MADFIFCHGWSDFGVILQISLARSIFHAHHTHLRSDQEIGLSAPDRTATQQDHAPLRHSDLALVPGSHPAFRRLQYEIKKFKEVRFSYCKQQEAG